MQRHIPLYTSVYPCLGQRYTEVYRGMGRGKQRYTEVPLFTSVYIGMGRGTQRYAEVTEVCRGKQVYAEVCAQLHRTVPKCIQTHTDEYGHFSFYTSKMYPAMYHLSPPCEINFVLDVTPVGERTKESHFSRWSEQFLSFVWRWSARFAVELLVLVSFVWRWSAHFLIELLCWLKIHWFQACFTPKNNKTSIIKKLVNQW